MTRSISTFEGPEPTGTRQEMGLGCLETERGNLPLVALEANWSIHGLVARGTVRQRYRNPLNEALEATYIFPLPERGAVIRFVMHVKDRRIEAELREREEARAVYDQAIEAGHRASIAEEERPDVFTIQVGNIPPKEDIDVELTVICPLDATTQQAMFRFPLVVAPRYVSGIPLDGPSVGDGVVPDTDEVPDASRVTPPVLLDGFPNPVRLAIEVTIHNSELYAPDWVDGLACTLHSVILDEGPPVRVRLQPGKRLDRDFILRIPLGRKQIASSFQVGRRSGAEEGVFSVTLVPPDSDRSHFPVDVVFVLDRSGSMSGWKIVAARRALQRMIDALMDQDRFAVVAFDNVCEWAPNGRSGGSGVLRAASGQHRWQTIRWLNTIDARGGTELGYALEEAVTVLARDGQRSPVVVIITDGQVAGEYAVLRRLQKAAGERRPRVLAVGIDEAVNAGLLRRLARWGNGVCELVESDDRLHEALLEIQRCLRPPIVRNVTLQPKGWQLSDGSLEPEVAADLYPGRPTTILGRFRTARPLEQLAVLASGVLADGSRWSCELPARPADADALLAIWGREKLRSLEDAYVLATNECDRTDLEQRIVATSLETHILCRFTALVAVDKSEVVNEGGRVVRVTQPVELPHGWDRAPLACMAPSEPSLGFLALQAGFPHDHPGLAYLLRAHVARVRPLAEVSRGSRSSANADLRRAIETAEELMGLLHQLLNLPGEDIVPAEILAELVDLLTDELRYLAEKAPRSRQRRKCRELAEEGRGLARELGSGEGSRKLSKWLRDVGKLLRELQPPKQRRRFWTS